jgi:hypothetical protein
LQDLYLLVNMASCFHMLLIVLDPESS